MSNLYKNIMDLCVQRGISGYRMCRETGIQPSILTDLKMGRQKSLSAINAERIASYFGVSVRELLGAAPVSAVDIRNSVVLEGNNGNNTVSNNAGTALQLSEQEQEVLRIFQGLDIRTKISVLSYLYDLEDRGKN